MNAVFNYKDGTGDTLMHAVVNASLFENMYLSTMNRDRTVLVQNQQNFKLVKRRWKHVISRLKEKEHVG